MHTRTKAFFTECCVRGHTGTWWFWWGFERASSSIGGVVLWRLPSVSISYVSLASSVSRDFSTRCVWMRLASFSRWPRFAGKYQQIPTAFVQRYRGGLERQASVCKNDFGRFLGGKHYQFMITICTCLCIHSWDIVFKNYILYYMVYQHAFSRNRNSSWKTALLSWIFRELHV